MEKLGLNIIVDSLGNVLSVFDFSFFISGFVTLGFIVIDLHYHGLNGILQLEGWKLIMICILAIYVCGLMSWSIGKLMRWGVLRIIWGKDGVKNDFNIIFRRTKNACVNNNDNSGNNEKEDPINDVNYTKMWIEIEKDPTLASKLSSLNKMWVMVALFEGLSFSWLVGLFVYFDGWLIGKWITSSCNVYHIVLCLVFIGLSMISLHRATKYARDLVQDVVATYYSKK